MKIIDIWECILSMKWLMSLILILLSRWKARSLICNHGQVMSGTVKNFAFGRDSLSVLSLLYIIKMMKQSAEMWITDKNSEK